MEEISPNAINPTDVNESVLAIPLKRLKIAASCRACQGSTVHRSGLNKEMLIHHECGHFFCSDCWGDASKTNYDRGSENDYISHFPKCPICGVDVERPEIDVKSCDHLFQGWTLRGENEDVFSMMRRLLPPPDIVARKYEPYNDEKKHGKKRATTNVDAFAGLSSFPSEDLVITNRNAFGGRATTGKATNRRKRRVRSSSAVVSFRNNRNKSNVTVTSSFTTPNSFTSSFSNNNNNRSSSRNNRGSDGVFEFHSQSSAANSSPPSVALVANKLSSSVGVFVTPSHSVRKNQNEKKTASSSSLPASDVVLGDDEKIACTAAGRPNPLLHLSPENKESSDEGSVELLSSTKNIEPSHSSQHFSSSNLPIHAEKEAHAKIHKEVLKIDESSSQERQEKSRLEMFPEEEKSRSRVSCATHKSPDITPVSNSNISSNKNPLICRGSELFFSEKSFQSKENNALNNSSSCGYEIEVPHSQRFPTEPESPPFPLGQTPLPSEEPTQQILPMEDSEPPNDFSSVVEIPVVPISQRFQQEPLNPPSPSCSQEPSLSEVKTVCASLDESIMDPCVDKMVLQYSGDNLSSDQLCAKDDARKQETNGGANIYLQAEDREDLPVPLSQRFPMEPENPPPLSFEEPSPSEDPTVYIPLDETAHILSPPSESPPLVGSDPSNLSLSKSYRIEKPQPSPLLNASSRTVNDESKNDSFALNNKIAFDNDKSVDNDESQVESSCPLITGATIINHAEVDIEKLNRSRQPIILLSSSQYSSGSSTKGISSVPGAHDSENDLETKRIVLGEDNEISVLGTVPPPRIPDTQEMMCSQSSNYDRVPETEPHNIDYSEIPCSLDLPRSSLKCDRIPETEPQIVDHCQKECEVSSQRSDPRIENSVTEVDLNNWKKSTFENVFVRTNAEEQFCSSLKLQSLEDNESKETCVKTLFDRQRATSKNVSRGDAKGAIRSPRSLRTPNSSNGASATIKSSYSKCDSSSLPEISNLNRIFEGASNGQTAKTLQPENGDCDTGRRYSGPKEVSSAGSICLPPSKNEKNVKRSTLSKSTAHESKTVRPVFCYDYFSDADIEQAQWLQNNGYCVFKERISFRIRPSYHLPNSDGVQCSSHLVTRGVEKMNIFSATPDSLKVCVRTFEYLQALACGLYVVDPSWLQSFNKSTLKFPNERSWEMWGDLELYHQLKTPSDFEKWELTFSSKEYAALKKHGVCRMSRRYAQKVRAGSAPHKLSEFCIAVLEDETKKETIKESNDASPIIAKAKNEKDIFSLFVDQNLVDENGRNNLYENVGPRMLTVEQIKSLIILWGGTIFNAKKTWETCDEKRLVIVPDNLSMDELELIVDNNNAHENTLLPSGCYVKEYNKNNYHLDLSLRKQEIAVVQFSWISDSIAACRVASVEDYCCGIICWH